MLFLRSLLCNLILLSGDDGRKLYNQEAPIIELEAITQLVHNTGAYMYQNSSN